MKPFILIILFLVFGFVSESFSYETGCSLKPSQLNEYGTNIAKTVANKKISMPRSLHLQSEFEIASKNGVKKFYGTFEGFFRPQNDDFISIIPLPILGFDLSKDRVVLYVCAHYSEKPEDSHLTIYFLRGYHLDVTSLSNFGGNWFFNPQLKVNAVPATLLSIGEIKLFFIQIFRYIPFVDVYFETFSSIQRFFANLLGDVTGLGVERVELTEKFFRVSSGVDLNSPRNARVTKTFTLKRPELGEGALTPKDGMSFSGDDEAVLSKLNSTVIEVEVTEDSTLNTQN